METSSASAACLRSCRPVVRATHDPLRSDRGKSLEQRRIELALERHPFGPSQLSIRGASSDLVALLSEECPSIPALFPDDVAGRRPKSEEPINGQALACHH